MIRKGIKLEKGLSMASASWKTTCWLIGYLRAWLSRVLGRKQYRWLVRMGLQIFQGVCWAIKALWEAKPIKVSIYLQVEKEIQLLITTTISEFRNRKDFSIQEILLTTNAVTCHSNHFSSNRKISTSTIEVLQSGMEVKQILLL